jgi:hypothetical protein
MKLSASAPTHPPECSASNPVTEEGRSPLHDLAFVAEQSLANVQGIVRRLAEGFGDGTDAQRCFEGLAQLIAPFLDNLSSIVWDWDEEMAKIRGGEERP